MSDHSTILKFTGSPEQLQPSGEVSLRDGASLYWYPIGNRTLLGINAPHCIARLSIDMKTGEIRTDVPIKRKSWWERWL